MSLRKFYEAIGLNFYEVSNVEILISTLGGLAGILGIFVVTDSLFGREIAISIVPSMGASAVLLFAAPHAPFSQPWNVVAGHLLSAAIGVACWRWVPMPTLAAASAVALAIGVMYLARCLHPPGGATALAAVIGSEELHSLGFGYLLQPVLLDTVVILLVALLFNGLFHWRRYPTSWHAAKKSASSQGGEYAPINHEDFVYALSQIDTIVDASEDDLLKIYQLATKRHRQALERDAGSGGG